MADDFNLQEEYKKLQKKFKLPDFKELDNDLELSLVIEKQFFLIKAIRRRLHDKIAFFARIIEGVIYPNTSSLVHMEESKYFSEEEKQQISKLYKHIVSLERDSNVLDIESTDKEEAKFIIKIYEEFKKIKIEIKKITEKMAEAWKKEDSKEEEGYFG